MIPDRWYASDLSMINDPGFFLAPSGRHDPRAEMLATLAAFTGDDAARAQCRYAARYAYLSAVLQFDSHKLSVAPCPQVQKFLAFFSYQGASLVFSGYYPNNPASLFGHSFLRLHRKKEDQSDVALLDDSVNFAAQVPDLGSWLYPLKGLTGFYPGQFSLDPYYRKVQEYSNYESRDLWEYELNLTPPELQRMVLSIWEFGDTYVDYYYLDNNCSYVMLALLEAAKPELQLTGKLWLYSVPADTLRAVTRRPGMIRKVVYRPSARSRYLARYAALAPGEEACLRQLWQTQDSKTACASCSNACRARVFDTALELIDFKEKLAGDAVPRTFGALRRSLLAQRAATGIKAATLVATPQSSRPDLGHDAGLLAPGIGTYAGGDGFAELHWRSALHDLAGNDEGYSNNLSIGFLDTLVRYDSKPHTLYFKSVHLLEINSLPSPVPLLPAIAWHLDVGYERGYGLSAATKTQGRGYVLGGAGPTYTWGDNFLLFGLLQADLGYGASLGWNAAPGLRLGAMAKLQPWLKLVARSDLARRYGSRGDVDSTRHSLGLAVYPAQQIDMRTTIASDEGRWEGVFATAFYF